MSDEQRNEAVVIPADPEDQLRWAETALRVRMLDRQHAADVIEYLKTVLNAVTLGNLGRPFIGIELFGSYIRQVVRLYDEEPVVTLEAEGAPLDQMEDLLARAEVWQIAQKFAEYVGGCRECAYRIGWSDRGFPTVRIVTTDQLVAYAPPDDPGNVLQIRHGRLRHFRRDGKTVRRACWDVWTADPMGLLPAHLVPPVLTGGGSMCVLLPDGTDVTAEALGPEEAANLARYDWRDEAGAPFLPWVLYHAAARGCLWSPYELGEMVDGAFAVTVLWNKHIKLSRDVAWNQRVLVDGVVPGAQADGTGARKIVMEPDSVLLVHSKSENLRASVASWEIPISPKEFAESIGLLVDAFLQGAGLHPDDLQRSPSAQSGYAIQLKRGAQRREARRYEPQFRRGDEALLSTIAKVWNVYAPEGSVRLPEDGWGITYSPPRDSIGEQLEQVDLDDKLEASGLISRAERIQQRHPSLTPEQAFRKAMEIAIQQAALTPGGLRQLMLAGDEPTTEDAEEAGRKVLAGPAAGEVQPDPDPME